MRTPPASSRGFTLIELSIVLTIIALIAGAIFAGQSLYNAALLRNVASKAQSYIDAINGFKTKYRYYPGDFPEATSLWGTQAGCSATPLGQTATCNGNGDGIIGPGLSPTTYDETFRAWQQLANAGMIDGQYTGVTMGRSGGESTFDAQPGINVPGGAIQASGYTIDYHDSSYVTWLASLTPTENYHGLLFGLPRIVIAGNSGPTDIPALTPEEAATIDRKTDDGQPGSGAITTYYKSTPWDHCTTTNDPSTAAYDFSQSGKACMLIFGFGKP